MSSGVQAQARAGSTIARRYRLVELVGRGGMGEVYRAFDEISKREVALKRFKLDRGKVEEQQRFRREFHTLARLRHPRVVQAYDYGLDDGRPFYTMELLDGPELRDIAPAPWRHACELLRDVASALAFLHTRGLLHRDVAPRNVRCTSQGDAKLLDFGMLATMGVSREVVGTLPSIPPEMLLGLPMDGRSDLFGLGALGYWLLTGRHPGRVRSVDELLRHGRRPPARPSSLDPDIPPELDELLLSMLSSEPLARPPNAAAVIERLESIAGLPTSPQLEIAHGYIHSAALVGRKREMSVVRSRLQRATEGSGGAVLIEGNSGMGKTRLLKEIELECKLAGAIVVSSHGDMGGAPYAVVRELAEGLIAALPDALDRPGSTRIGQLLSPLDLAESTGWHIPQTDNLDKREERLELQAALGDWLSTFGSDRPMVLIVDDIQRADEASAAALASLAFAAHDKRVMVVAALRTDEPARHVAALDKLREAAAVIRAKGLSASEVTELVGTIFGEAEGLPSLAASIHRLTGGNPLLCVELLRHLVENTTIRYAGGMWVIPDSIDEAALPSQLEQAMDARVSGLSPHALDIAQALSVHRGELSLSECVHLSSTAGEADAFEALDELIRKGFVLGHEDSFRAAHDGLAEATLRTIDELQRPELELRVAELLLSEGQPTAAREAQVGWHLIRGGRELEGADLLARSGKRLYDATSFGDAVPQLEAALQIYRRHESSPRVLAELYTMLITAGFYSDRDAVVRHSDDAIEYLGELSGLTLGAKLRRFVGRWIAIIVAIIVVYLKYFLSGRRRPRPIDAVRDFSRCTTYTAGTAGFSFDTDGLRLALQRIDLLAGLPLPSLSAVQGFIQNLLNFNLGRLGTLYRTSEETIAQFGKASDATEAERQMGIGGARFQRGLAAVRAGNPKGLREVDALRKLGKRLWDVGALQLRAYYHLWRGEESLARRYRAQIEVEFLRLGSLWQLAAIDDPSIALMSAYVGDTLALRRSIAAIERLVEAGLCFEGHLAAAKAEYHRLRGDLDAAQEQLERAFSVMPEGEGLIRPWVLCLQADLLFDRGKLDEAIAAADEALALASSKEYGQPPYRYRAGRTRALAKGRAGRIDEATEELDSLTRRLDERKGNPLIVGLLHEARALIALWDGQERRAEEHALVMESRLAATKNPVLVARCERLRRLVRPDDHDIANDEEHDEMVTEVHASRALDDETLADMMSVLSGCHTAEARAERSLELILSGSGAQRGFLFVSRHGRARLAAPRHGDEPPASVLAEVEDLLDETRRPGKTNRQTARFVAIEDKTAWVTRLLKVRDGSESEVVVGAVALLQPEGSLPQPPATLLDAIARRLVDAGDIASTPLAALPS